MSLFNKIAFDFSFYKVNKQDFSLYYKNIGFLKNILVGNIKKIGEITPILLQNHAKTPVLLFIMYNLLCKVSNCCLETSKIGQLILYNLYSWTSDRICMNALILESTSDEVAPHQTVRAHHIKDVEELKL